MYDDLHAFVAIENGKTIYPYEAKCLISYQKTSISPTICILP